MAFLPPGDTPAVDSGRCAAAESFTSPDDAPRGLDGAGDAPRGPGPEWSLG